MTSKQRAYLRGLANQLSPIFQIGKNPLNDNFYKQVDEALEARELIKLSVLSNSFSIPKEISQEIALATNSFVIQVVGSKFVLYRESKEKVIHLP
jgi:RNA-binding protein